MARHIFFPEYPLRKAADAALAEHVVQVCLHPEELGGRERETARTTILAASVHICAPLAYVRNAEAPLAG